ncbi:MAG: hypothetical protein J6Y00_00940 [Paludibacteraceae bacterium]|nr:hypothetical protein [Paludibacteraceae bacterium]
MKARLILCMLAGAVALSAAAQQTTNGFTAIGQNGQEKAFLLENFPRLTFHTSGNTTTFTVKDTKNTTMSDVKTCVFGEVTASLPLDIVLQENEDAQYYDRFAQDYNGVTVITATLNRQFANGKWATLCLPFDVKKGMMLSQSLYGRVFEFKYAELTDAVIVAHFSVAQSIEAGKGYIVNANAKLAAKTSFVFPNVTINTSADNGDIETLQGYNDGSGRGNIYLAGTLRTGILYGSIYLGLKNNVIYYPNSTTGTVVRAYRGFFLNGIGGTIEDGDDEEPLVPQRVRMVVEGEPMGELEIAGGDMAETGNTEKVLENGVLYILRNGVRYDAQGKRID